MKQGELNPLQKELARGQQAEPHPDADVLTAFAEGSLLTREREELFAHLAACAQCREVLHSVTEAVEEPVEESKPFLVARPTQAPVRRWISWASVAAGIVLVSSVGLVYRQRMELKGPATANNAPGTTSEVSALNQPSPPLAGEPKAAGSTVVDKSMTEKLKNAQPIREAAPMPSGGLASAGNTPAEGVKQSDGSTSHAQVETAQVRSSQEEYLGAGQTQNRAQAQAGVEAQAKAVPAPAASFVPSEPLRALSKTSFAAAASAPPRWRIDSAGVVERAIGSRGWEKLFPDENGKMRVVSVYAGDVWVGGESTRLYHSADNGYNWALVTLPTKGNRDHAIIHITFKTQLTGTVEAEDGTSWTTTDGGASWN